MSAWRHELRLLVRTRLSLAALVLLAVLAACGVAAGLHEVAAQRATLARLGPLQEADAAAVARRHVAKGDAGYAAYYGFEATWDPPSDTAFLALGLRDVAPAALRVRALGLQAQLYEGETFNPELALAGRFDFAFVLIFLAPLFIVALLHDTVSGEREAGRLGWLQAMPGPPGRLWRRRAGVRLAAVFAALAVPLSVGAVVAGAPATALAMALAVTAAYVAVWGGVSLAVAAGRGSSTAHATVLVGVWLLATLVAPALAHLAIQRAVPVNQGVDLMLAHRQNVHAAWEVPREATMARFFASHPAWRDTAPLPATFHWKWYLAFHQLGDESVASDVAAYRDGLRARQRWSERVGWLLPGPGAQVALHRLAGTDLPAHLAHLDAVAAYHADLRRFYYPFLFRDRPIDAQAFAQRPRHRPAPAEPAWPWASLGALVAAAAVAVGVAWRRTSRGGAVLG